MRAFTELYIASLREFRRDSTALLWSMLFPVIIALVVGAIFSGSGKMFFRVGLVNEAGGAGEVLVNGFEQNKAFQVTVGSRADELAALEKGQRDAVLVLSPEIAAALQNYHQPITDPGAQVPFEVHYDPTSPNGSAALSMIQQTMVAIDTRLTGVVPLFKMQAETADMQKLRTADYMLPGVLAMSMLLLGLYVTAMPLVSLRQKEVLRRMGVTPLSRATLLAVQVVFRLTVALIQALVIIGISVLIFDLPLQAEDLPATIGMVLLGAAVFITFGYFLAALAKTEEAIQVIVGVPFLVFTMLSGVLVPLWRIPSAMRPLVDAIPLTYLADALRQLMVGHNPSYSMTTNVLVLVGWLVVFTLLAWRFFRWEPSR